MSASQRISRGFHRAGFLVAAIALITCMSDAVFAGEIATCTTSKGYGYYPKAGLNADTGKWVEDGITGGKFTLARLSEKEFDLLITDATGRVFSAKQDGGSVFASLTNRVVSAVVMYPTTTVVETYTFFRNADGNAEVMWTSNKGGGAPIMKVAAFRADCSFFAY